MTPQSVFTDVTLGKQVCHGPYLGLVLKDKEVISQVLFVVAPVEFIRDVIRHIMVVALE